jgi:predicted PurR-regulated permease PerM
MAKKPQPTFTAAAPAAPTFTASIARPTASRGVMLASYLLMLGALMLVMWEHLLPGLICVCIGFLVTRWFARLLQKGFLRIPAMRASAAGWAGVLAVIVVLLAPAALVTLGLSQAREYIVDAPDQYRELLDYTARTVLELRSKLPPDIATYLPEGAAEIQRVIANYLRAQAGSLAMAGRAWLHGLLFSYVGLIVGSLAAVATAPLRRKPLAEQLHQRVETFGEAFAQIVAAQFWIAAFNTLLTAIFLLFLMPLWGAHLPYTPALITLTFLGRAGADRGQPGLQFGDHAGGAVGLADHGAGLPDLPGRDPQGRVRDQRQGGRRAHADERVGAAGGDVRGRGGVRAGRAGGSAAVLRVPEERAAGRIAGLTALQGSNVLI